MVKLPGVGKETVIDFNLCGANKILRTFEEIGKPIRSNANGVGHQVHQVFLTGVYYDWVAAEPHDPLKRCSPPWARWRPSVSVKLELEYVLNLAIVRFKV